MCNYVAAASTVMVKSIPQRSLPTPVMKSSSMEYRQHKHPSSCVTIVSDTHTTFSCSPVTTLSVVECLTSVVTSISEQVISTVTTTAGEYAMLIFINYVSS